MFKYISSFTRIYLLTAFALINVVGCESETLIPEIKYNTVSKKEGNCDVDTIDNCVKIKFTYPEIKKLENEEVKNLLNKKIVAQISQPIFDKSDSQTVEEMMTSFINEYKLFIQETDYPMNWELSRSIEVQFSNENIFSVSFAEYSYLGGAHPNSLSLFFNYDLSSGGIIELNELFIDDYEFDLNSAAEKIFRKNNNLSDDEDLNEAGFWFEDGKFKLNKNFLINKNNLIFYFNNYEITAYAFGPTEIIIPYADINHLINQKGLLAELVK